MNRRLTGLGSRRALAPVSLERNRQEGRKASCVKTYKEKLRVLSGCVLFAITIVPARGAAPANDRFSNRIVIPGTNTTVMGSNAAATKESGEPNHAGNLGGSSVWWAWTAPANGEVRLTTDGSDFDTLLGVTQARGPML